MLTEITPDVLVPHHHPIQFIKSMVDKALTQLSATFDRTYADQSRASIPPEHLLKACLIMAPSSMRSGRQSCERPEYDLLFKWFLDLNIMDHSFNHSMFSKNKDRPLDADVAREFFLLTIVERAREQRLLPEDRFSVDGMLIEARLSLKSFRPRDEDPPPAPAQIAVVNAIRRWTFAVSGAAMRPKSPTRIPRLGRSRKAKARKPDFVSAPACLRTTEPACACLRPWRWSLGTCPWTQTGLLCGPGPTKAIRPVWCRFTRSCKRR